MDHRTPPSQRKRPRVSFSTERASGGSILEHLFDDRAPVVGKSSARRRSEESDARVRGLSRPAGAAATKSSSPTPPPSHPNEKGRNDVHKAGERRKGDRSGGEDSDTETSRTQTGAALSGGHRRRGGRSLGFRDSDDSNSGSDEGSTSDDDSVESNDKNEKVLLSLPTRDSGDSNGGSNEGSTSDDSVESNDKNEKGTASLPTRDSGDSNGGSNEGSTSDDSVESNDTDEKGTASLSMSSKPAGPRFADADGAMSDGGVDMSDTNPSSDYVDAHPSQQSQWKDDSNDSDYEMVDEEEEEEEDDDDDESDEILGSNERAPRGASRHRRSPSSSPRSAPQNALAKINKKRVVLEVARPQKRRVLTLRDTSDEDGRQASPKRRSGNQDPSTPAQRQQRRDQGSESVSDAGASESESNLSFPNDDDDSGGGDDDEDSAAADDGMWRSLGGYIDDLSGNKPVHRSAIRFGMRVIEEEYQRAYELARRRPTSSSASSRAGGLRTVSLARVKAKVLKAVRVGLRATSLPNLYIRVEDPCGPHSAKRTKERQSAARDEADVALRLIKERDRFAKKAEALQRQVDEQTAELEREPPEVYKIHPQLRMDPPAASDVNAAASGSKRPQFLQAPDDASIVFLESLFPSPKK